MTLFDSTRLRSQGAPNHRPAILGLAGLGVAAYLSARFYLLPRLTLSFDDLLQWARYIPLRCPTKLLTGLDCPLCGLGRSLLALVWGDLSLAWAFNLLGPVFAALSLIALLFYFISPSRFFETRKMMKSVWRSLHPAWRIGTYAFFILIFALRNI